MKMFLIILMMLLHTCLSFSQSRGLTMKGDTLIFIRGEGDTVRMRSPMKTINGSSVYGSGDITVSGSIDSSILATLYRIDSMRNNLWTAIAAKYSSTNPSGYITSSSLSSYKQIIDSGRSTSNYVTGGGLKKLNDSTIAAIAALYGSDYRAATFVAGTNYLAPNGSAASLTGFPTFNQNTTGSAATLTTPRNINGVAFNGSANITVPSDIAASNSGNVMTSNGSVWTSAANNGGWSTLRVSGSNATTTGQALTPITGLVTPTLTNATLYEVEAVLYVSTTNVTTGTQYAFTANGTGGAATVFINVSGTTTTNAATTVTQSASGTAAGTFLTTSSSSGIIVMKGFILTRGSGTATIELDHLKVTSGTSTVLIGSKFQYRLAQ